MKDDEFRITARIRRADGVEKTVTFIGNAWNMKKKMKQYFKAESFQIRQMGPVKFSVNMEWESTEEKENLTC